MNFERLFNTTGLFLAGTCFTLKGVVDVLKRADKESPITLLTTGTILLPLSILIGIATRKIFDDFGWQATDVRFITICVFSYLVSTTLASGAALGFGLTASLYTGWKVSFIAIQLLLGISCVALGLENILLGTNHTAPRIS